MIDRADRGELLFLGSIAVSAVLVVAYLAAGGSDYAPAKTQDPCKPREWRNPEGLQEIAAAVLALGPGRGRLQAGGLARDPRPGPGHAKSRGSSSCDRYEDRRRRAGPGDTGRAAAGGQRRRGSRRARPASSPYPLRGAIRSIPLDQAIELVNDARSIFEGGGSIVGLGEAGLASSKIPARNRRRLLRSRGRAHDPGAHPALPRLGRLTRRSIS